MGDNVGLATGQAIGAGGVRSLLGWFVAALSVIAFAIALCDQEAGLAPWFSLRSDVAAARSRVATLNGAIAELRADASALQSDPLAVERAIREELDWSRPGELMVRLRRSSKLPAAG